MGASGNVSELGNEACGAVVSETRIHNARLFRFQSVGKDCVPRGAMRVSHLSRFGGGVLAGLDRPRPSAERPVPPRGVRRWYCMAPLALRETSAAFMSPRSQKRRFESRVSFFADAKSARSRDTPRELCLRLRSARGHARELSLGGLGLGLFLPLNQRTMSVPKITSCNTNCAWLACFCRRCSS